jgi:pimeloyl-ACP methyl ester carboxylesterase
MEACWRCIEARVLLVVGGQSDLVARLGGEGGVEMFRPLVRDLRVEQLAGAGHMLHHEEPRAIARLIESFVGDA